MQLFFITAKAIRDEYYLANFALSVGEQSFLDNFASLIGSENDDNEAEEIYMTLIEAWVLSDNEPSLDRLMDVRKKLGIKIISVIVCLFHQYY